jgi:hypothetical protein
MRRVSQVTLSPEQIAIKNLLTKRNQPFYCLGCKELVWAKRMVPCNDCGRKICSTCSIAVHPLNSQNNYYCIVCSREQGT